MLDGVRHVGLLTVQVVGLTTHRRWPYYTVDMQLTAPHLAKLIQASVQAFTPEPCEVCLASSDHTVLSVLLMFQQYNVVLCVWCCVGSASSSALLESFAADLWVCYGWTWPASSHCFNARPRHIQRYALNHIRLFFAVTVCCWAYELEQERHVELCNNPYFDPSIAICVSWQ